MSCAWVPASAIWPSDTTRITSQSSMVERRCAIAMEVRSCFAASKALCTRRSLWESSALVASSRSKMGGFRTKARQMATRCFCPPDKRAPRGPTCVSQPCAL
mmetsp:Transcript_75850/g.120175  ORF Transcript_75850/g.120175 Transcript_75850/m.120175 type:complete len:102 (+) Transcript_75850:433-738(+)